MGIRCVRSLRPGGARAPLPGLRHLTRRLTVGLDAAPAFVCRRLHHRGVFLQPLAFFFFILVNTHWLWGLVCLAGASRGSSAQMAPLVPKEAAQAKTPLQSFWRSPRTEK